MTETKALDGWSVVQGSDGKWRWVAWGPNGSDSGLETCEANARAAAGQRHLQLTQ